MSAATFVILTPLDLFSHLLLRKAKSFMFFNCINSTVYAQKDSADFLDYVKGSTSKFIEKFATKFIVNR